MDLAAQYVHEILGNFFLFKLATYRASISLFCGCMDVLDVELSNGQSWTAGQAHLGKANKQ